MFIISFTAIKHNFTKPTVALHRLAMLLTTTLLISACTDSTDSSDANNAGDSSISVAETGNPVQIDMDADDIGGVVTNGNGPEAGVWVIAETHDFESRFSKIVVTDDEGRYVIPDLPDAEYEVWVRGYGLVDSDKTMATPGQQIDLIAVEAPNEAVAAQYYPAAWWASLLEAPPEDAFPITNLTGTIQNQAEWIRLIKGDWIRQQYGLETMREFHPSNPKFSALGLESTTEVLNYLRDAGQYVEFGGFTNFELLGDTGLQTYVNWIDTIQNGAIPEAPPRPQGLERNIVVTTWDAGPHTTFSHDIMSSDKRDPTVNANGNVYFADWHNGDLISIDPARNSWMTNRVPSLDAPASIRAFTRQSGWSNPSPTWGDQVIIEDNLATSSLTMDHKGRIWLTSQVSSEAPDFCRPDSGNPFAAIAPSTSNSKNFSLYDPATDTWELIPTCFGSNHPTMAVDGTNRVFTQGGDSRFLWVDADIWDETHNPELAQGWCQLYYDADGDGSSDMDAPVQGAPYGPMQSMLDGSIWGTVQTVPGRLIRLDIGDNPPESCIGEAYNVPEGGSFSRGVDVDSNGVVWTGLAGSGDFASFDRRLCEGSLTGPEAMIGNHCPEGWTLYETPGPKVRNTTFSSDFHYYNFIDKYGVIGLGPDTPLVNGTNSDSLMALDPDTGEWTVFRLPYPVGSLYTRNMDVRIDDPDAGWKGTGLWAANDTRAVWHGELGLESRGLVAKFQLRTDPLAH